MVKRIVGFLAVAGALVGGLVWSQLRSEPRKVSGFIEADEIRLGSRIGGRVQEVAVDEGQEVQRGDVLVRLEPFDLTERRWQAASMLAQKKAAYQKLVAGFREEEIAQAKARKDQLEALVAELKHGPRPQEIAAARKELELAQAELDLASKQYDRVESLVGSGGASRQNLDEARTSLQVARANVAVNTEKLALLEAGTRQEQIDQALARLDEATQAWLLAVRGYREEEIAEAKAAMEAAEAALASIDRQIGELTVTAPRDGVVEAVDLQPGDLVTANAPVVSLLDLRHLWIRAYVPEGELNLRLGQPVRVTVDSDPDRVFRGRVSFIARQAEFTPGNVQTPEERSKLAFRIKVVLPGSEGVLRPGMMADVWLEPVETDQ